jgi:hypothetical protein
VCVCVCVCAHMCVYNWLLCTAALLDLDEDGGVSRGCSLLGYSPSFSSWEKNTLHCTYLLYVRIKHVAISHIMHCICEIMDTR